MNADHVRTEAEAALRDELAACYRIFNWLGWTELIFNHISVRLPGPEHHFLINPLGLHYSEVTASNLVKIDLAGNIIGPSTYAVYPGGFTLHSALHRGIPEARCVMHIHTTAGCAVAGAACGLSADSFYGAQMQGRVAYHDFEGVTVHAEEGPRLLQSIGQAQAVILRNHGLLSWGPDIPNAFIYLWSLQRACEIQVAGAALGLTVPVPAAVQHQASLDALQFDPANPSGRFIFDALRRQVERADPSFKN
jgi:ribulose-5-phosphate 4-epimerase/fuculose-1-phosphate aldolase